MPKNKLSIDQVGQLIYEIRAQRMMLDSDLAAIYGVETKALNRAVFGRGITGGCSLTADLFANGRSRLGDCPLIFLRQGACRHSLDNLGSPRILGLLAIRDALCV